jgi:hypothetical protein
MTNAGQPISWDDSITQIRFGSKIHRLSQLVNVLLAPNTSGVGVHLPNDSQPTSVETTVKPLELNCKTRHTNLTGFFILSLVRHCLSPHPTIYSSLMVNQDPGFCEVSPCNRLVGDRILTDRGT